MWSVYVLSHTSGEIYIGVTENLKRRINEHKNGGVKFTTRKEGVWSLAYAENYADKNDAYAREARLKQHGRAKQELLRRIQNSLSQKVVLDAENYSQATVYQKHSSLQTRKWKYRG